MIPLLATSSSPFLDSLRDDLGLDHCEATGACKSEIGEKGRRRRRRFCGRCEANHTHVAELALIRGQARPAPVSKDRTDESAADGLLVVQVCPLGTISRKIPQAAPPLIRRRDGGRPWSHQFMRTISARRHASGPPAWTADRLGPVSGGN